MSKASVEVMTKALVEQLLAMNTSNRPVRKDVINRYARDLSVGHWRLTNQGIGVSSDGVLIDGQHRLLAMRQSGYPPVQCVIVYGLDESAQNAVDQHAKRSARDVFRLSFNCLVSRHTPAILQVLSKFESLYYFGMNSLPSNTLSIDDMFSMFEKTGESIEAVLNSVRVPISLPAPVLAAIVHKHHIGYLNNELIGIFMEQVLIGENLTRKMPAFHLRNYLAGSRQSGAGSSVQKERYLKTVRALEAFKNGEEMGVLRA